MAAFARFVMRDNGLAIHINPDHVTQMRQTIEGGPAIYIAGRDTPMMVEGTLESALRKLEAAAAGIRVVEADKPELASPTEYEATFEALAPPEPDVARTVVQAAKPSPRVKPIKSKVALKAVEPAPAKAKHARAKTSRAKAEPEAPYPAASWFKGNV